MRITQAFQALLRLVFPSRCVICRRLTADDADICPECARELEPTGSQVRQTVPFCDGCYSPFYYAEPLRASFLRYKFEGSVQYARTYGRWMADCVTAQEAGPFDLITWAPLPRRRRRKRGYDQAEELAKELGRRLGLPVRATLNKAARKPLSQLPGERSAFAEAVDDDFGLVVRYEDGTRETIFSGEVSVRGLEGYV